MSVASLILGLQTPGGLLGLVACSALTKGEQMNSLDILIGLAACGMGFMFMVIGYSIGYKHGHGEGFVRGRAIAKALKESELI